MVHMRGGMRLSAIVGGVALSLIVAGGCAGSEGAEQPVDVGPSPAAPEERPDATQEPRGAGTGEQAAPGESSERDERPVWREMLPEHAGALPRFPVAPQANDEEQAEPGSEATESPSPPEERAEQGTSGGAERGPRYPADPQSNPVVATVDGVELTAADFVDRLFHMHHDWYLQFMRELYVERIARKEAEREGIEFSEGQIEQGFQHLVAFYQDRARRMGKSWRLHWEGLGYPNEQAYLDHLRRYVTRLMLLDRLIKLLDMRLTKVDFSQIVIPDSADRFTPDPEQTARELAEDLRSGEAEWNAAVRRHSADWRSAHEGGRQGVTPRGFLGVPEMDDFLFNNDPGAISDPIYHPLGQWRILKINAVHEGHADVSYGEVREEIEAHFAEELPGTVRHKDTFVWLEQVLQSGRYDVRTYSPLHPEKKPWIAQIDGEPLTARDFLRHATQTKPDWAQQVITEVIVFHVAGQEAQREGIELSPSEVRDAARQTLAHLKEASEERGQDFALIWQRRGYESESAFRRSVIEPRVRESMELERLVFLHDRRIERRELWHVLTQAEPLARRVRERIVSGDTSFEEAAERFSQHRPTQEHGGRIGIVPADLFGSRFSEAAFSLEPGEISEPVETENGWHVIRATDVLEARPTLTWPEARAEIEAAIAEVPGIPGDRVPISDTYRWIAAVQQDGYYEIYIHVLLGSHAARAEWYEEADDEGQ